MTNQGSLLTGLDVTDQAQFLAVLQNNDLAVVETESVKNI